MTMLLTKKKKEREKKNETKFLSDNFNFQNDRERLKEKRIGRRGEWELKINFLSSNRWRFPRHRRQANEVDQREREEESFQTDSISIHSGERRDVSFEQIFFLVVLVVIKSWDSFGFHSTHSSSDKKKKRRKKVLIVSRRKSLVLILFTAPCSLAAQPGRDSRRRRWLCPLIKIKHDRWDN